MNTAARVRTLLESNKNKDVILKKLEENQLDVQAIYEKEISLLKIQLENHEDKEETMHENLVYYMDENVRLKNELKVVKERCSGSDKEDSNGVASRLAEFF